jgi:hypothetical protein
LRLSLVTLAVASAFVAAGVAAPTASACCIWTPEADRIAGADVIFEGVALEGATETGIQRFRVTRYLKGAGPEIINVNTYHRSNGSFIFATTSVSIHADAGSEWRIFGYGSPDAALQANSCTSRRLPLPPLGQEPPPPSPPGPVLGVVPAPEPPAGDERSSGDELDLTSADRVTPVKTLKPRPKAKRLLAKKSKKAKKRMAQVSRRASRR